MMPMWASDACQTGAWGNWMMSYGIVSLLLFLLAIAGIVALFRLGLKPRSSRGDASGRPAGLEVLERRYAAGEIEREEYLQKKADLGG